MKLDRLISEIVNVSEANQTRFTSVSWNQDGNILKTPVLDLEGLQFKLKIEVLSDGLDHTYLNVGFARIIDGNPVETLVDSGNNGSKAIGAVSNALRDKISELDKDYEFDAKVFFVNASEPKRVSLYKRFIQSDMYGLLKWKYRGLIKSDHGIILVASKKTISPEEFDEYKSDLQKSTGKDLF